MKKFIYTCLGTLMLFSACKTTQKTSVPCTVQDDVNYYRQTAVSLPSYNVQMSRQTALSSAKRQLSARVDKVELDNVEQICEKITRTEGGHYVVYVAIQIKK